MKIVYSILTLFIIAIIAWWIRSPSEDAVNVSSLPPAPKVAKAYAFYTEDKEVDKSGSTRDYQVVEAQSERIQLSCNETVGTFSMVTGNTFKGRIGFNPKTGEGVWSGEYPNHGIIQTGKVQVAPNSYGGYEIVFTYDDGHSPCRGRLAPIW